MAIKTSKHKGTFFNACYHRLVMMKSIQFLTNPGIIDLTRLQRWTGTMPAVISVMVMRR